MSNQDLSCDALVIGTGMGGSTFALALARRGFKVIVVEEGDSLRPNGSNLVPVHMARFNERPTVGGLTKFFGAAMYRNRETDFEAVEMEAGLSPAWPYTYAELEPYYCEAEKLYKVHGSPEHDATEPPRSAPFPHDPIPHQGPVRELVDRVMNRAGVPVSYLPRGIDYDPTNGGKCVLCAHCDAYYCPRDAKMDAEIGGIRPAIATGNVKLLTGTKCLKVLTTPDGKRATGAIIKSNGVESKINAGLVAVACGIAGTPSLLYRSRTSQHPNGLANGSGSLGRFLAAHTVGWIFPLSVAVQRKPFHQKTFAINSFYHSIPGWKYPGGAIQSAGYMEMLSLSRRYRAPATALLYNSFQVFYMIEGLPTRDTGFSLDDDGCKPMAPPLQNRKTFAKLRKEAYRVFRKAGYAVVAPPPIEKSPITDTRFHSVGTARMGNDPKDSVVNSDCKAHDVDGLYVVDACCLPTPGGVNTALTIVANALRAASKVPLPS